ncbi:MAG TPA: ABC transporter permease subunit [Pyrinomonadaceae bacterium]|nr:ABC transporter permease subunit [Pyrinomonadaceae bacterium]
MRSPKSTGDRLDGGLVRRAVGTSPNSKQLVSLIAKEWRELLASRSYWLLLLMIGPLVGHGFITAVGLYAEASGSSGGPAALAQGLTPLDGILVPAFGAYDLAATFLFPFVAIRIISAEKQSGGLKLLLQLPGSLTTKVGAKALALLAGWIVTLVPGVLAILLWKFYGGHLHAPETLNLLLGHFLRATLSGGIAFAAAALAENAASAAIVTLGVTVGTWALDFIAAGRGGWLQQLAAYTPTATLRFFEHGLLRLNVVVAMLALSVAGFALAGIWLHTGRTWRFRLLGTMAVAVILVFVIAGANSVRASWDASENRRNSFSRADEVTLSQIRQPLKITVVLSPEDPRLTDFEQNVLRKLRRVLPHLDVDYSSNSRTGLFEKPEDHYGEIWYEMNGQKTMERSTIEEVVLEQIYKLAAVNPPSRSDESTFSGYPLSVKARGASLIFYGLWPLIIIVAWWIMNRRR